MGRGPEDACWGKHAYTRMADARNALRMMTKGKGPRSKGLGVYACPHCAHLHLGHRPGTGRKRSRTVERRTKERPWCWSVEMN